MWFIAFWPLWTVVSNVVSVVVGGLDPTSARYGDGSMALRLVAVFSWLVFVWLAYRDNRELKARQIDRPFGWGWGFLPLVYLIGRTAVVYRQTRRGLAPLFVFAGVWLSSFVLAFAAVLGLSVMIGY
jgi:hypothetical protein